MRYSGDQSSKVPATSTYQSCGGLRKLTMADRSSSGFNSTLGTAEDTLPVQMEPNTEAGDFWLVEAKYDHSLYPVVICDEDMIKSLGMSNNRPESASRPIKDNDKYWRKPFRTGGSSVNKRSFPAMYLHSLELYVPLFESLIHPFNDH